MSLQTKIIKTFGTKSTINACEEINIIKNLIKKYLNKNPKFKSLVVGISGGQDSTLTGKICQMAVNELNNNHNKKYHLIAIRMPYGQQLDEKDCNDALSFIKPDHTLLINIKNAILASEESLRTNLIEISDYVRGNMKARERMKILYAVANMKQGLVVGTENAAELLTGYFTKHGDGAHDINPIFSLNKRQGRQLLKYLKCPSYLYLKTPTADLEDDRPNLPDEIALNITYNNIDDYLEGKIINQEKKQIIEDLYIHSQHKRNVNIKKL